MHAGMRELFSILASLVVVASCAEAPLPSQSQPAGYQQKLADADAHDRAAAEHLRAIERAATFGPVNYTCNNPLDTPMPTSATQVTRYQPCWDYRDEVGAHQVAAMEEHDMAEAERRAAKELVVAERAACANVPEHERDHSAFSHRRSISEVIPHFEDGVLRGVRIVFKPVAALDADWLRRDIACQQAHVAVLGRVPASLAQDPTLVRNAEVSVSDVGGRVVVVVRTDENQARLALAKARGLGPSATTAAE